MPLGLCSNWLKLLLTNMRNFLTVWFVVNLALPEITKILLFFKKYKYGPVNVPAPTLHLDIEKSIKFFEKHAPTLAMIHEFMGAQEFDKFIETNLAAGKRKMNSRHRAILSNAKFLGFGFGVGLASFLLLFGQTPAIAGGLSCPAPVPLTFELQQKFPVDIVNPTPAEQAYF